MRALTVVKSNLLIEANYHLSLIEQQLILFSVCQSRDKQEGLTSDKPVTIIVNDFVKQFGVDADSAYSQIKKAIALLYERNVFITKIDEKTGNTKIVKSRWISESSYIAKMGQCEIIFAPSIIPFITQLDKCFTSYELNNVSKMTSIYGIRLYEILKQYVAIGRREIEISDLRKLLGIDDGQYKVMKDFKLRVVDVAVEQINIYSDDINVDYTSERAGRSIKSLIFNIKNVNSKVKTDKYKKKNLLKSVKNVANNTYAGNNPESPVELF